MKICEFAFKISYQNSQVIYSELFWRHTLENLSSKIKVYFAMHLSYHFSNLLYPAKCLKIQLIVNWLEWNVFLTYLRRPRSIGSHGYSSFSIIL